MSIAPDIHITEHAIGGGVSPVRLYYIPNCLRCGWLYEPCPTKEEAQQVSGIHLRMACLMDSGGGDEVSA